MTIILVIIARYRYKIKCYKSPVGGSLKLGLVLSGNHALNLPRWHEEDESDDELKSLVDGALDLSR